MWRQSHAAGSTNFWQKADPGHIVEAKLNEPLRSGKPIIATTRVDMTLAEKLEAKGVTVTGTSSGSVIGSLLSWLWPVMLLVGVWVFFGGAGSRQSLGRMMAIGKSRAKVYVEKDIKVTSADVARVDEAKFELQEVVLFLKNPENHGRLGAHVLKGILLVGPPGTGKTLLTRAVAGEARVAFFSMSGSEFVELFVGLGAARVRDLFEQARKAATCMIFIDELDALGRSRVPSACGGHVDKEQTRRAMLVPAKFSRSGVRNWRLAFNSLLKQETLTAEQFAPLRPSVVAEGGTQVAT